MARRINAPGIEVNEIDRSNYEQTVDNSTIGTATLVFGFADKGDDYTVRWMNTMNTFTRTYGTPKTDAERYFFNSVYEIVNGGGVCYTAKLPYCNDSMDNFVYTSYTIDPYAVSVQNPLDIVDGMVKHGVHMCLSDYTDLQPVVSSMCITLIDAISALSVCGMKDEISEKTLLSDGFLFYGRRTVTDMFGAVGQLGELLSVDGDFDDGNV